MKVFFYLFPLFDQQNKSLTLVHDSKPADLFFKSVSFDPFLSPLFYPPWSASECTLSSSFLYQPLSSLESCKSEDLVRGERTPLNRKEAPVIFFSPVVAGSNLHVTLPPLMNYIFKMIMSLSLLSTFPFFLLPLLGEAWALTHVFLTVEICSSVAGRKSLPHVFFFFY